MYKASFEPKLILLFLAVLLGTFSLDVSVNTGESSLSALLENGVLLSLDLSLLGFVRLGEHEIYDNACNDAHKT